MLKRVASLLCSNYCRQEDFSIVCEINGTVPIIDTGVIGFLNESDHIFVKLILH